MSSAVASPLSNVICLLPILEHLIEHFGELCPQNPRPDKTSLKKPLLLNTSRINFSFPKPDQWETELMT